VCEVKYQDAPIGIDVIGEVERKIQSLPVTRGRSIHKVLITSSGSTKGLQERAYFDSVLTLEDLIRKT
jgi:hypothetical protein